MTPVQRVARRRNAGFAAGLALVAALTLAACGTGTPAASGTAVPVGAQPVRNGGLVPGSFVDLPKPAGARSYGAPTLSHGAWTQSFEVDGLSPAQTMQFYVTALQGSWG
ncbi:MAG: hypothetical protein QOF40_1956, partial [Actinomycetota bacterium]|nr:hypothetical protein [Actinomycetota bacterium]